MPQILKRNTYVLLLVLPSLSPFIDYYTPLNCYTIPLCHYRIRSQSQNRISSPLTTSSSQSCHPTISPFLIVNALCLYLITIHKRINSPCHHPNQNILKLNCIVCISNSSLNLICFILAHVICIFVTHVPPCLFALNWRNKIYLFILFIQTSR